MVDINEKPLEVNILDRKIAPNLPDKADYERDLYFIPGTNRSSKKAKELFEENWKTFEEILSSQKLGFDIKLELARDYIGEINDRGFTDEGLLKSMRRSFAARIGRQKRQARLEGNLPKWEDSGHTI